METNRCILWIVFVFKPENSPFSCFQWQGGLVSLPHNIKFMKVLHLDVNHPLIIEQFNALGFQNDEDYT
ncbi:MAG: hypothetical protein R3294_15555, partial [Arenibacter troitsensis]|nr:hypothetical protein [Arenibacter troitsensis]